ncbi:retron system putative HNH endonuclease [Pseudomonas guariconensis]|uniref:retron system putative HNH endonuclease n=1 Tax=Pseudomonas guariconensis TaxID=1288410 RepID=UPI00385058B8
MKRVNRLDEPAGLTVYRAANPLSTWEQMRGDATGRTAYESVRLQLLNGQGGLCAFCEIGLHDCDPLKCRVEHFHPKSDNSTAHNWGLDWQNMVCVCTGGSQRHQQPPYALEPLPENLSCDAHKDKMINTGKLDEHCKGWVIDPRQLPALLSLFFMERSSGRLLPDEQACASIILQGNKHPTTQKLVLHTIDMLNLNCARLCEARRRVHWDIERNKKSLRLQNIRPEHALRVLAERYFRQRWPVFFTTIRFCLGTTAEQYLTDIGFQG